jgi:pyruvate,water dikinase
MTDDVTWEPPGPGSWTWLASHAPGAPTPWFWRFNAASIERGFEGALARFGAPVRTIVFRPVHGKVFQRVVPLVGASSNRKPPPAPILWLATRLHPEFRRRSRRAAAAFEQKVWRDVVREWETRERSTWETADLSLQDEDVDSCDDDALADHVRRALDHCTRGHERHFELHVIDLGPIGDLIAHCGRWGIGAHEVVAALEGSSPASTAGADEIKRLARLTTDAGRPLMSLDDVRAIGPEAADALDTYLRHFGWRMVTNYDVDGRTLIELPNAVLTAIRRAGADGTGHESAGERRDDATAALRERVPAAERATFDELLAEARLVYGLRDDNGPLTAEWPLGLLRRALLEAGRRLHARGAFDDPEHVVELTPEELQDHLTARVGPAADVVAARAAERAVQAKRRPPRHLGPEEAPPPLHVLPPILARVTEVVLAATAAMEASDDAAMLTGTGVGSEPYTGRARVADVPEDALAAMEPGDVLVAAFTNPAFNSLLSIAGAVVTEQGGVLCHAAVMARELRIPAVVGARGAMHEIGDGDTVEVDPVAGRVRVLTG